MKRKTLIIIIILVLEAAMLAGAVAAFFWLERGRESAETTVPTTTAEPTTVPETTVPEVTVPETVPEPTVQMGQPTEPVEIEEETVKSGFVGLALIVGVLTFFLVGALVFKFRSRDY